MVKLVHTGLGSSSLVTHGPSTFVKFMGHLNSSKVGLAAAKAAALRINQQGRKPMRHLGMSRGDGRGACKRTCLRLDSRFTEEGIREEPK
jgi:hypothetical protein